MKYLLALVLAACFFSCKENTVPAQTASDTTALRDSGLIKKEPSNPYVPVDVSPMDMLYFPADYPLKKMNGQAAGPPVMRVIYSRPHRAGRHLFGGLLQWGQPWRLGANEATEIEFFQSVTVLGKKVEEGSYVVYAIPYADHWTLVLNKGLYSWGLKFNPADDVAKFDVPVTARRQPIEHFTMSFEKTPAGADLIMAWETTETRLPVQF